MNETNSYMKKLISVVILLFAFSLSGCNSKGKSDKEVTYEYQEVDVDLNAELKARIGSWAKQGIECYGVLVALDGDGLPRVGMPIKAKIVRIKKDQIKMKSLANVNFGPQQGCTKMGISSGETWWETEGDLFQTKEEAEAFLNQLGILSN